MTTPQESLNMTVNFIRLAAVKRSDPEPVTLERIRFAEILWLHAGAGVDATVIPRLVNYACNPEMWQRAKSRWDA